MRIFSYRPDFVTVLVFVVLAIILVVMTMEMWLPHGL